MRIDRTVSMHVATRRSRWTLTTLLLVGLAGCGRVDQIRTVVLGSTTSLYDSGLLDELVASFEAGNPDLAVRVLAVGTGQALELGRRGDADLLLVHAPDAERLFVQDGHGRDRVTFMRNDFVIAGPSDDPARVRELGGEGAGPRAVAAIAASGSRFLSRGDDSGTHMRERALWEQAGIGPAGDWYEEAGQGMGGTLVIAAERGAYLLTDRATLTVLGDVARLEVLASGGSDLENLYSVVAVTRGANPEGAERLRRWVLGEQARQIIAGFGVEEYGRQLFTPLVQEPDSQPGPAVRGLGLNPFAEAWQLLMSRDLYVLEVVFRSLAISCRWACS
jgi:tungstate transport system substrate-binding protein